MRSLPTRRSSRRAASRSASGEGRWSLSVIHVRYYQIRVLPGHLIEREVEQQHIDARLAQHAKQPVFDVFGDKLANTLFRQVTRLGDPGDLKKRGIWRDVRIKAAGRGGNEISRDLQRRVFLSELVD